MNSALAVWCVTPHSSGGWGPVTALGELAGQVFGTTTRFIHPQREYGRLRKAASLMPRPSFRDRALLLIAAHPGDLLSLTSPAAALGGFDRVGVWIIDSFWDERIPLFARKTRAIDHVWITDGELVDRYRSAMRIPCEWLPWGTDALAAQPIPDKSVDVLRLGRQPNAWEDDDLNRAAVQSVGLSYQGRFPMSPRGSKSYREVLDQLRRAKVVLGSSSLDSPTDYRHPTRDYISARFTDAVACGARIAGSRPQCMAADELPEEAWVPIDIRSRSRGAAELREAILQHDPQRSARLAKHALQRLDWRHRLRKIADGLKVSAPELDAQLALVHRTAEGLVS